jgi:hypothetical protein
MSDQTEREARYAARIADPNAYLPRLPNEHIASWTARAVIAIADQEQAELRAALFADVAATLNDRADMWQHEFGSPNGRLVTEWRNMANAYRTYAEGVGVPGVETLRRKRDEARAERDAAQERLRAVEALADEWVWLYENTSGNASLDTCVGELRTALGSPVESDAEDEGGAS